MELLNGINYGINFSGSSEDQKATMLEFLGELNKGIPYPPMLQNCMEVQFVVFDLLYEPEIQEEQTLVAVVTYNMAGKQIIDTYIVHDVLVHQDWTTIYDN